MKAIPFIKQLAFAPALNLPDYARYVRKIKPLYEQRFQPVMITQYFSGIFKEGFGEDKFQVDTFFNLTTKDRFQYIHATDSLQTFSRIEAGNDVYYEQYSTLKHCSAFTLDQVLSFLDCAGYSIYWNIQTRTKYLTL